MNDVTTKAEDGVPTIHVPTEVADLAEEIGKDAVAISTANEGSILSQLLIARTKISMAVFPLQWLRFLDTARRLEEIVAEISTLVPDEGNKQDVGQ